MERGCYFAQITRTSTVENSAVWKLLAGPSRGERVPCDLTDDILRSLHALSPVTYTTKDGGAAFRTPKPYEVVERCLGKIAYVDVENGGVVTVAKVEGEPVPEAYVTDEYGDDRVLDALGEEFLSLPYRQYLKSNRWAAFCADYRKSVGEMCESGKGVFRCRRRKHLQVHHLHYGNLGNEEPNDVILLCWEHHLQQHPEVAERREKERPARKTDSDVLYEAHGWR